MKFTKIVTAKIYPDIFKRIETGRKLFEVRLEDFQNADFIRYVSSEDGATLGIYRLGHVKSEIGGHDYSLLAHISNTTIREAYDLFHGDADCRPIYVAEICERVELSEIFAKDKS
jgi:hypothetical protein